MTWPSFCVGSQTEKVRILFCLHKEQSCDCHACYMLYPPIISQLYYSKYNRRWLQTITLAPLLYTTSLPLTVCLSAPTSHGPTSYWLPLPTSPSNATYPTGIYTLYIIPLTFFIHLPMKMEPIRSSETSAIKTQTPGNYPERNILPVICLLVSFNFYNEPFVEQTDLKILYDENWKALRDN